MAGPSNENPREFTLASTVVAAGRHDAVHAPTRPSAALGPQGQSGPGAAAPAGRGGRGGPSVAEYLTLARNQQLDDVAASAATSRLRNRSGADPGPRIPRPLGRRNRRCHGSDGHLSDPWIRMTFSGGGAADAVLPAGLRSASVHCPGRSSFRPVDRSGGTGGSLLVPVATAPTIFLPYLGPLTRATRAATSPDCGNGHFPRPSPVLGSATLMISSGGSDDGSVRPGRGAQANRDRTIAGKANHGRSAR